MVDRKESMPQKLHDLFPGLGKYEPGHVPIIYGVSVPQIITGFILSCIGIIPVKNLLSPEVWVTDKYPRSYKYLPLFHGELTNPQNLNDLISTSDLTDQDRVNLHKLVNALQPYRRHHRTQWWEARGSIQNYRSAANLYLHDFLSSIILANFADPQQAFRKGVMALGRLATSNFSKD